MEKNLSLKSPCCTISARAKAVKAARFVQSRKKYIQKLGYPVVIPHWVQLFNSPYTLDNSISPSIVHFPTFTHTLMKRMAAFDSFIMNIVCVWCMCYAQWNIQYFLLLLCECSHKKRINKIYQIYNGLTRLNIIQNLFQCDHQYMYILFNPMWFKVFTSTSRREREKNQQKNSKIVSLFAVQINILFVLFSSCSTDGNINKLHVNF